jgi:AraC-like DNA-binding protein
MARWQGMPAPDHLWRSGFAVRLQTPPCPEALPRVVFVRRHTSDERQRGRLYAPAPASAIAGAVYVKLVLDGTAEALVSGGTVRLEAGHGFIWQAAHPVPCRLAPEATWWHWLHVDLRGCDPLAVELIARGHQFFRLTPTTPAVRRLLALREDGLHAGGVRSCTASEAARLGVDLLGAICDALPLRTEMVDPLLVQVETLCRQLATAGRRPTLALLARQIGLSPDHVARRFRQSAGRTIGQHVRACLLEKAHRLVVGSRMPIGAIAAQLGYRSAAHFAQAFRRHHGCSPGELRHA